MAAATVNKEMQSFAARQHSFQIAHQVSKRRASANTSKKRGAGNAVEWPHQQPDIDSLASAGFFFQPGPDSEDNVKCFLCEVKLDGWEPTDDPIKEHVAHSADCAWALSMHAAQVAKASEEGLADDEPQDPMSEQLSNARRGTFAVWPHEGKRGWKCKISKMVEAGWCFDPALQNSPGAGEEEEADGTTCFYCLLSLDGWEPKDDPLVEHRKRMPDCPFFKLCDKFGGKKAAKARGKKGSRASQASSRLSTQSVMSTVSQMESVADSDVGVDDSVVTTASQATVKGKKKSAKAKAATKGAKGRKRADTIDSQLDAGPVYPDLGMSVQTYDDEFEAALEAQTVEEVAPAPAKKGRNGTRQSKQPQGDSSVVEISSMDAGSQPKKATRGRKAKAQPLPEVELELEVQAELPSDHSEVSAQLQEEFERSMDFDAIADLDQSTPQMKESEMPKRGVKRTSDGMRKQQQASDVSAVLVGFPVPPKTAKGCKKGPQASKQIVVHEDSEVTESSQQHEASQPYDVPMSESEAPALKQTKASKASTTKGKGKGRKASSARSSKVIVIAEPPPQPETEADLAADEREIEAELERIAAEQAALQIEQEKTAEFEASPSQHDITSKQNSSRRQSTKKSLPPQLPPMKFNATPSPAGSDKENQPSSRAAPNLSPTKPTRIPLAPGTPVRPPLSPSKNASPSKILSKITSAVPWQPIDLDAVLLASPQPTPRTLAQRLGAVAGALTSPEKGLTVEGWVKWRAEKAEEELRRRCEGLVGAWEKEGIRAVCVLEGIRVGV